MNSGDHDSDAELLERSARGDEAAFLALYRRSRPLVYRYALRMTGDPVAAEEAVQAAFVALVEKPAGFDAARGDLAAYLIGTARHQLIRKLGRDRLVTGIDLEGANPEIPLWTTPERSPLEAIERDERSSALGQALDALPAPYKEAVTLCDIEGLSYAQAAAAASVAIGTIRSRLHRARRLLLEKLNRRFKQPASTQRRNR